jgi:hypothetical protein
MAILKDVKVARLNAQRSPLFYRDVLRATMEIQSDKDL